MNIAKNINPEKYYFSETSFNLLMQKRIRKVLLICSNYDAFMLEEDGRIDEQIFNEYVSLNLRYPPVFVHAESSKDAFKILESERIDLVIEMLSIGDIDAFELAKRLKTEYAHIPIVVLTHFSREVSLKLENEDLSAIDYVFCWLGNADLLVAIIKLIEDKMNAGFDVEQVGVQTILFVEDSIRYFSTYLPHLYKTILVQTQEFIKEALNEHQKMLRRRGRPKILLATNLEDAITLYRKFKNNLLGVISDISYRETPDRRSKKTKAGFKLCQIIKEDDPNIPVLLQSSDISNAKAARELNAGFIHKYSKNLTNELKDFITLNFGFGDFVFRDPITLEKKYVASDLRTLQSLIFEVPDDILIHHTSQDDFSKWLKARALFPIAEMLKVLKLEDFSTLEEVRKFIYKALISFRASKARGVIAEFDHDNYDEYLMFSRIGEGSIGGKARGLAFINSLIKKYKIYDKYKNVTINIPRTVVLSTDIFDEYMEQNALHNLLMDDLPDDKILQAFLKAELPSYVIQDLKCFLKYINKPLAIRSSSKLEDSHYQPFAGIYNTYMIPVSESKKDLTLLKLVQAIKCVYASVYFKSSRAYIRATSNAIDEEKMGIILQEVCGSAFNNIYYPTISGVARSVNYYPINPEKSEDGVANIAYGLGKYIVDGGLSLRFSPKYPRKIMQLSSTEQALKTLQNKFYALDLSLDHFKPSADDTINIVKLRLKEGEKDPNFKYAASTYDFDNEMIRDNLHINGRRIISFSNILNHKAFPLSNILQELLFIGHKEMSCPIEIEFAVNIDAASSNRNMMFNFLQIRPIVERDQPISYRLESVNLNETIIYSTKALGNGYFKNITDLIYVKPEHFNPVHNEAIARSIEKLNNSFNESKRSFILMGPGRWGSKDPWLGIPIIWPQISNARVIVEWGLEHYRIEPSQGTHFFHNLTTFNVGYFTVNPYINDGYLDVNYLNSLNSIYEDEHLRQIRFSANPVVCIDGKSNIGVVYKVS